MRKAAHVDGDIGGHDLPDPDPDPDPATGACDYRGKAREIILMWSRPSGQPPRERR